MRESNLCMLSDLFNTAGKQSEVLNLGCLDGMVVVVYMFNCTTRHHVINEEVNEEVTWPTS